MQLSTGDVMDALNYLQSAPQKFLFDGCKLIYHQKRLQQFLDGERIMPIHIDMGIHKNCNIRCTYCYGYKQKMSKDFISEDRLLLLADDAKQARIKSLAIIGDGEPTLNEGLYPFVEKLKALNIDGAVATNGLRLDEGKIKALSSSLVWLRFNVSAVENAYTRIHRGADREGGWSKFEENVKLAVEHKGNCTIGLQMVLIPDCFDQVIPLALYARKWGVDYLVIKQFSDPEEAIPITFDMDEYEQARDILLTAQQFSTERTKVIVKWSAIHDSREITKNKHWGFDRCIDLPFIFQISGNGGCYPCGYLFGNRDYCYGSVVEDRLINILTSKRYWSIIEKIARTPLEKLCKGQCRHCETLKFMDRLTEAYEGNLRQALIKMCGGEDQYRRVLDNPPAHINFI